MTAIIRLATRQDAEQTLRIYAPIVNDTVQSFELSPPAVPEMAQRIMKTLERLPWLCCEQDGTIVGYAYANSHRVRAAYQWSVEVSVYVHVQHRCKRIGQGLYVSLFNILRLQGFVNAYAGITLPNADAVRLHEKLEFKPIGIYEGVTYKFGAWHDVGWWQLQLQERVASPIPPIDLKIAQEADEWQEALMSGEARIRG